jgi:hypothetical protein
MLVILPPVQGRTRVHDADSNRAELPLNIGTVGVKLAKYEYMSRLQAACEQGLEEAAGGV